MREQLNAAQVAEFRAALRARWDALYGVIHAHVLKTDEDRARLLADRVRDQEDESLADLIVDLDLAEIDRDIQELREVEAALERTRDGRYGRCANCGGSIPLNRLAATPTATRCHHCQEVHEKTYARPATPSL